MFEPAILPIVTAENMQYAEVIVQVTCMTCMVEAGAPTAIKIPSLMCSIIGGQTFCLVFDS
jgi:hypothetical protein